jgi:hypothetical protein
MVVPRKMRSHQNNAASGNLFCVRKDGNHAQLLRIDSTSMHRELYWLMSQAAHYIKHAINISV